MRSILRPPLVTLCMLTAWLTGSSSVTAHTRSDFEAPIGSPRADSITPERFVVSFAVGGDLHGLLTLTLTISETGTAGEWALVTSSPAEEDSQHEHEHEHEHEHVDLGPPGFAGTLAGTVSAAALAFDTAGTLIAIDSASLEIESGSLRFEGATGRGTVEAIGVDPEGAATAQGTLRLDLTSPHGGH